MDKFLAAVTLVGALAVAVLKVALLVLVVVVLWKSVGVLDQASAFFTDTESAWTAPWLNVINRGPVQ